MKKLAKFIDMITAVFSHIGSIIIFATMFLMTTDIISRLILNKPIPGTPEIVKNVVVIIAFLMIPYGMTKQRHVRSTMLLDRLGPKSSQILDIFSYLVGLVLFILVAYASFNPMIDSWINLEYSGEGSIRVPTYPVRTVILISSLLMIAQCFKGLVVRINAMVTS